MISGTAAGTSPERRIALIKPQTPDEQAGHAVQLFDSVLWVFKGTTRSNWVTAGAAEAHIIVAHHSEPAERLDGWRKQGKLIITLSTDVRSHPAGPRTLLYPFPVAQVLSVLEHVEADLDTANGGTAEANKFTPPIVTSSAPGADPWSFVEELRTLRIVNNATMWLTCKSADGPFLWVQGDGRRYFCDPAVAMAIRSGALNLSGLSLQKGTPPPGNLPSRSGCELFWFATYHASPAMAPWLNVKTTYRLLRWPDFGRLRAVDDAVRTAQLRIVATLDEQSTTVAKLAARSETNIELTMRTLNALGSCELIDTVETIAPKVTTRAANPSAPPGGFKQFLRSMRKHLGLRALA